MSWRDRAIPESSAGASGSWRDRAIREDDTDQADKEAEFWRAVDQDYEDRKPGMLKSAVIGAYQGATRNWGDEAAAKIVGVMGGDEEQAKAQIRQGFRRAELENPKSYATGDIAGAVVTAPAVATPLGAAAYGLGEGFARSLGESSTINENALFEAGQRGVTDAALAAAFTKYGPRVFEAVGKTVKPAADKVRNWAGEQAVRALGRATPTQLRNMEERKILGKTGNWAMDNGVVTPFSSNKTMLERSEKALENTAEKMRPIYKDAAGEKVSADKLKALILQRADRIAKKPGGIPLSEKLMGYHDEIEKAAQKGRTEYSPADIKKFRQRVQDNLNFNSEPASQEGGRRFRNTLRGLEMGLIRRNNPDAQRLNEKLFESVHLGNNARDVAARGAAQTAANNKVSLSSNILGGSVASGLLASGVEAPIVGAASLGVWATNEILKRYGNQWSGLTARRVAQAIDSDTYRPLFEAAAKRGGAAVASLHDQLMNSDPAYSGLFDEKKKLGESTGESKLRAAGLAASNNLLFGADDEVSGASGALLAGIRGEDMGAAYTKGRDTYRNAKEAAALRDPWMFHGTDLAMNVATPALGAASKGATEMQRIARGSGVGALIGGLTGAGNAKDLADVPRETFSSAIMGGLMGGAAGGLNAPKASVRESGVPRRQTGGFFLKNTPPTMERPVNVNGQDLLHRVYHSTDKVTHYLVDAATGEPVAELSGRLGKTVKGPGLHVKWSRAEGGRGYGKTLYDLALDTHQNMVSDSDLSQMGSHRVYSEHFAKQPGVKTDLASWGNTDPHKVYLEDPVEFHGQKKFPPFAPQFSPARASMEENALGAKPEGFLANPPRVKPPIPGRTGMPPEYERLSRMAQRFRGDGYSDTAIRSALLSQGYDPGHVEHFFTRGAVTGRAPVSARTQIQAEKDKMKKIDKLLNEGMDWGDEIKPLDKTARYGSPRNPVNPNAELEFSRSLSDETVGDDYIRELGLRLGYPKDTIERLIERRGR